MFGKKRPEDTFSIFGDVGYETRAIKKEEGTGDESEDECIPSGPVRIVHKDHESISAFCLNQVSVYFLVFPPLIEKTRKYLTIGYFMLVTVRQWLNGACYAERNPGVGCQRFTPNGKLEV